jgi:hypothetical protein
VSERDAYLVLTRKVHGEYVTHHGRDPASKGVRE